MPILVFRCDDYSIDGGQIEEVEHALVELFAVQQLPLVFGVIPARLEERQGKIEFLRPYLQQGFVEIALHGWDHQAQPALLATQGIKSELQGRTYADQKTRLSAGKHKLEECFGQPVHALIPPWDSYDLNTLQVCRELALTTLSADIYSPQEREQATPVLLPSTLRLHELADLLEEWSRGTQGNRVAIVEFHAYEFYESGHALANFSLAAFIRSVERAKQLRNIHILTMTAAAQWVARAGGNKRYRWAQRVERSAALLYATTWRNRIGNWAGIPERRQPMLYEPTQFYVWQELKQQMLYHLPHISLAFATFIAIFALYYISSKLN